MKKPTKVLQLHRETLQALDSSAYRKMLGGTDTRSGMTDWRECCDTSRPCTTG
jgi:hypothetical protein